MTDNSNGGSALSGALKLLVIIVITAAAAWVFGARRCEQARKENEAFAMELAGWVFEADKANLNGAEPSGPVVSAANYAYYCGQAGIPRHRMTAILKEAAEKAYRKKTP